MRPGKGRGASTWVEERNPSLLRRVLGKLSWWAETKRREGGRRKAQARSMIHRQRQWGGGVLSGLLRNSRVSGNVWARGRYGLRCVMGNTGDLGLVSCGENWPFIEWDSKFLEGSVWLIFFKRAFRLLFGKQTEMNSGRPVRGCCKCPGEKWQWLGG